MPVLLTKEGQAGIGAMEDYERIIQRIQYTRAENNKLWMDLVRLAMCHAPRQTKRILSAITKNDQRVSEFMKELTSCSVSTDEK